MLDNVRIHLDSVEDLGEFLEFEAMVGEDHDENACRASVDRLLREFDDAVGPVIGLSNLDLALHRHSRESGNPRAGAGTRSTGCPPARA